MPNESPIRSRAVRDILERIPAWPIMWGNTLLLSLILLVIAISWFIKYPDVITAEATLTTATPSQKAIARRSGRIAKLTVKNGQKVSKGQLLAVLENTAAEEDVFYLKAITDTITYTRDAFQFPLDKIPVLFLGEIEPVFTMFENAYWEYKSVSVTDKLRTRIKLLKRVIETFNKLKNSILEWEINYVIKSQINGQVIFYHTLTKQQSVEAGDVIFNVLPEANQAFIAILELPVQNISKVVTGQKVLIELVSFPKAEFGVLVGSVKQISIAPNEQGNYVVQVAFPQGLHTSYGHEIEFKQEVKGSAEVITEDLRLIDRFLGQLKRF